MNMVSCPPGHITACTDSFTLHLFRCREAKRCKSAPIWKSSLISLQPHGSLHTTDTILHGVTTAMSALRFLAHPKHGSVRAVAAVVWARARDRRQASGCFCWSVIWCGNQRDGGVVFEPDPDEGLTRSGGGQREHTGSRLQFGLFLPFGFKDTDVQQRNPRRTCFSSHGQLTWL